jgi:Signal transduction histidine kinase involved in nitrogen fixation and metabolism regulation
VDGAVLLASIGLALLSFWVAFSRILRPLFALTGAMDKLANGDFAVVLPGLGRKDEIGDMAQAVETFKVKAEQKARQEAEAKMEQDRIAAEQRKTDMYRMADDFESAVGEIVETVSSASTSLKPRQGRCSLGRAVTGAHNGSRGGFGRGFRQCAIGRLRNRGNVLLRERDQPSGS